MRTVAAIVFLSLSYSLLAQDTFSIVAVDPSNGQVGSAGASCIDNAGCGGCGGVIIISGIAPGKGAINAQANVCLPNINLNNGIAWMNALVPPTQIIDSLLINDVCAFGDSTQRQYGIADLDASSSPRTASFTGSNCLSYANHITGPTYSVQGNILLGQQILDSIEARFLNTPGDLACKLMSALQGANVAGADTRCLSEGVSSRSAFVRMALPGDTLGPYTLDLNVPQTPFGYEPIDSLQTLFNAVHTCPVGLEEPEPYLVGMSIFPNPTPGKFTAKIKTMGRSNLEVRIYDITGKQIEKIKRLKAYVISEWEVDLSKYPKGIYFVEATTGQSKITQKVIHQ